TMTAPVTGGWQTWTTVTKTGVNLTAGAHTLKFVAVNPNYNFNYMSFAASSGVPQAQIAAGTATIDGTVEAAWNNATSYSLTKTTGTVTNSADCSAIWKGMWD